MIKIKKSEYYQIIADANKEMIAIRRKELFINEERAHYDKNRVNETMENAFSRSYERIKRDLKKEVIHEIVKIMKEIEKEEVVPEGFNLITDEDLDFLIKTALHDVKSLPESNMGRIRAYHIDKKYKKEE